MADRTHREKGMDDVRLDGAERLVSNHNKDLLFFLQADEVTEPGLLGQPAKKKKNSVSCAIFAEEASAAAN